MNTPFLNLKKAVFTFLTIVAGFGVLGIQEIQSQVIDNGQKEDLVEIIETAFGNMAINSSEGGGIQGAIAVFKAVYVPGDSMPSDYTFEADATGKIFYENVLVFHDNGVGISPSYSNMEITLVRPNPSSDFTISCTMDEEPTSNLLVLNSSGSIVGSYPSHSYSNNIAVFYTNLSDLPNGIYHCKYYDGENIFTEKLIKHGQQIVGNLGIPKTYENVDANKSSEENEAIYQLTISAEGYDTLVVEETFIADDNGWKAYTLQVEAGIPQHQDIVGIAKDGDNNNAPLANITAILFNETLNITETITTGSDGKYTFEDVPIESEIFLSVGGDDSKYSFVDIPYSTPLEIEDPNDTINEYFSAVLYDKMEGVITEHIIRATGHGTQEGIRKYFYGSSVSQSDIDIYEGYYANYMFTEPDGYQYVRTMNLAEAHYVIEDGTFNTQTDQHLFITPLGESFYPTFYATSTMHPGNYFAFVHENKLGVGNHIVAHQSVLNSNASVYTSEDKKIGQFEKKYWVEHFYNNGDTYFGLEYITDSLD